VTHRSAANVASDAVDLTLPAQYAEQGLCDGLGVRLSVPSTDSGGGGFAGVCSRYRVSTTPGNLLAFKTAPGKCGNCSWNLKLLLNCGNRSWKCWLGWNCRQPETSIDTGNAQWEWWFYVWVRVGIAPPNRGYRPQKLAGLKLWLRSQI